MNLVEATHTLNTEAVTANALAEFDKPHAMSHAQTAAFS